MRTKLLITLLAVAGAAAPAAAQTIGAPALPEGSTRELVFATMRPGISSPQGSGAAFAVSYEHRGRVNLAARVGYHPNADVGQYAELGSFGALPVRRIAGVDLAWNAGVGYGGMGAYVPAGLTLSRPFQLRALTLTPFAHGRLSLAGIDPFGGEAGNVHAAHQFGVDVGVHSSWSVRAGAGGMGGDGHVVLGFAYRR